MHVEASQVLHPYSSLSALNVSFSLCQCGIATCQQVPVQAAVMLGTYLFSFVRSTTAVVNNDIIQFMILLISFS